jgi:diaminohydroxyphosphoribosylaminopyrimidine deaminase/5-amino-6-(5-phosphoribosylamino)uracil reductase
LKSYELYMQRCIDIALFSNGKNRPNPEVGSVIVHNGLIIGEGWHAEYGKAHAEVNAINSVKNKELLAESTLYVTLEPCFHFGKTPPCVDLILKHKIPEVVIGCTDPYHEVAGKSIQKLKDAGVKVTTGILADKIERLNRRFFTNVRKKRPYVVLKYAVSADGFMGMEGQNIAISGKISQKVVHRMRAEEAAIMVGTNTAKVDNPRLDIRYSWGIPPVRVVLDRDLKLPKNLHLFDGSVRTIVFTSRESDLQMKNVEFVCLDFNSENFISELLEVLHKERICSVLVEGGRELLNSFIIANLWDEAHIIKSTTVRLKEGIDAPQIHPKCYISSSKYENDNWEFYLNEA